MLLCCVVMESNKKCCFKIYYSSLTIHLGTDKQTKFVRGQLLHSQYFLPAMAIRSRGTRAIGCLPAIELETGTYHGTRQYTCSLVDCQSLDNCTFPNLTRQRHPITGHALSKAGISRHSKIRVTVLWIIIMLIFKYALYNHEDYFTELEYLCNK